MQIEIDSCFAPFFFGERVCYPEAVAFRTEFCWLICKKNYKIHWFL